MEILDAQESILSNFEVIDFLRKERNSESSKHQHRFLSGSVGTILLETLTSLESGEKCKIDDPKIAEEFLKRIQEFDLTNKEKLMLLNHCPTTAVEIHAMIENGEERLKDDKDEKILQIVSEVLLKENQQQQEENMEVNQ